MSVLKPALLFVLFIGLLGQTSFCSAADEARAKEPEELPAAIAAAIRRLEAKEYETFLRDFVNPDDLKKVTEKTDLAKLATQFKGEKADRLLRILKSIKDATPKFEKDGELAVFPVKVEGAPKNSITFVKVDKFWYIKN
jgi:hypothetical protein